MAVIMVVGINGNIGLRGTAKQFEISGVATYFFWVAMAADVLI